MIDNLRRRALACANSLALLLGLACATVPLAADAADHKAADDAAKEILQTAEIHGGLIVHVGCGDGKLTAALRAGDGYLVHGLDTSAERLAEARAHIQSRDLYGEVSVDAFDGQHLPYADNVVNLVVLSKPSSVEKDELLRVLAPGGVAAALDAEFSIFDQFRKARSDQLDQWTHYLYDASNNAVSKDKVVGPPAGLQWVCGPKYSRSHEHLASFSALVTAGGRLFSLEDDGPIESVAFPPNWFLVARDAFNGITLWKRKMGPWEWHLREFRHGPPQLTRRLVATADRVFLTLAYGGPVEAIDPATGQTTATYRGTEGAEELVLVDGLLLVVAGDAKAAVGADARRGVPAGSERRVLAIDTASGKTVWEHQVKLLAPVTLGAAAGRAFYQDGPCAVAVDLKTGSRLWQSEPMADQSTKAAWYSPVLVAYQDVLLWADGKMLTGLDAATGRKLWQSRSEVNWHAPPDVLVAGGLVWTGQLRVHQQPGITRGLDPKTGEVKRTRPPDEQAFSCGMTHHRCYRNKATERWLLLGRAGTEFLDVATGDILPHHWVRGTCQYGIMPANGLLYAPPHACACFLTAKLNGLNALTAERRTRDEGRESRDEGRRMKDEEDRLERGPAYSSPKVRPSSLAPRPSEDWPTYRHDAVRSGRASTTVSASVRQSWQAQIGGRITPVTIAQGKCFVAAVDAHAVHALDARTGKRAWTFTAGGRVDSPPTIADGLAVFGCRDGYVYCLRASDGALVWRFRASPEDRRIVSYGQLESLWPVDGAVLVQGDAVAFAAGRSSYLDGGIRLYRVALKDGRLRAESRLYTPDPATHRQPRPAVSGFNLGGALPDVLASDGQTVFMRQLCFAPDDLTPVAATRHLFSPTGLLDDSWWHRTYWLFGDTFTSGWPGWWQTGNKVPAGRVLVFDDANVYGFGRKQYRNWSRTAGANWAAQEPYHLFAASREAAAAAGPAAGSSGAKRRRKAIPPRTTLAWSTDAPVRARGLVLADQTLFFAGTPNLGNSGDAAQAAAAGRRGALLVAVSAGDGSKLAETPLPAPPVLDGLAAADGRLYLATRDGRVVCLTGSAPDS